MPDTPSQATHLIAGNWKMNGLKSALPVAQAIAELSRHHPNARVAIFPPATLLPAMAQALAGSHVSLGAQDCHHMDSGAFTGDLSAAMLRDAGAQMVILGHSERRHGHLEPCSLVARKAQAALRAGLQPLICIGETLDQRQSGLTRQVLERQLSDSLPDDLIRASFHVSYEPVWAIGTGLAASDEQIEEAFALIRNHLQRRFGPDFEGHLLYGGSVKPHNARQILNLPGISGALVGGASLSVEDFAPIIAATD
jgi:triosephosphate isomerase